MKLKKLIPELANNLIELGFDKEPKAMQSLSVPKIKSGLDLFMIAPPNSGKSTAILIGLIQQLKEPFEEAPRAIVICKSKEETFRMEELFQSLAKNTGLRSFVAFDQGIIQYQKDEIYDGLDVLFCTPRRLTELVNINGVPMTKIKMLIIDDATEFFRNSYHSILYRIGDGIKNPQIIIAANEWEDKFESAEERIMKNPFIISPDE